MSSFRAGMIVLGGVALMAAAAIGYVILLDHQTWALVVGCVGLALVVLGIRALRTDLRIFFTGRRGEIALYTAGLMGVYAALGYLSDTYTQRWDLTTQKRFSLSPQTEKMLAFIDKPVKITFFRDPMMRETVELYELMVKANKNLSLTLYDPVLNPAQARRMNVQFAGTAILESEDRRVAINGPTETDIANGLLRVSQGKKQRICFLDGHNEADPFSQESHDHMEGTSSHKHGLGDKLVLHEQHGMAKARNALETLNYSVEKISLVSSNHTLSECKLLVVAGPKMALLPQEVEAIRSFLREGGNGFFMLDPFISTGLESVVEEYSMVLEDTMIIDPNDHFWTDSSAPSVRSYNFHQITRDLPLSFYPGARTIAPTPERVAGTTAIPLANSSKHGHSTSAQSRAEFREEIDQQGPLTIMAVAVRNPARMQSAADLLAEIRGDEAPKQPDAQAVARSQYKPSRLVVVGDSDFATNSFFHQMGNGKMFLNAVNYLAAQENLIGVEPRTFDQPRVNLTNRQLKGTFFLSLVLIPALLALIGFAVWWKQR